MDQQVTYVNAALNPELSPSLFMVIINMANIIRGYQIADMNAALTPMFLYKSDVLFIAAILILNNCLAG